MTGGSVTISIDLELAWGNWDNITAPQIDLVREHERVIVARLIEIFDRYEVPVTWAIVAALLDRDSARERPGGEDIWYAPDVIETITSSTIAHDIGSHGGRHIYFDSVSGAEAADDLDFAQAIHASHGLDFASFVFPRNRIGKKSLIEHHGIRVYRGEDRAWHQRVRGRVEAAGRIANLVDKMLPIAPEPVRPERDGAMVNLPGSMLFLGKNGLRRFVRPGVTTAKLKRGLAAAEAQGGVFHLWFHPSNFYHDRESQFALFERFIGGVRALVERNAVVVKPMAAYAAA